MAERNSIFLLFCLQKRPDFYLWLEPNAVALVYALLYRSYQTQNVATGAIRVGNDEIGVFSADLGLAEPKALKPGLVNEGPGALPVARVLKYAP